MSSLHCSKLVSLITEAKMARSVFLLLICLNVAHGQIISNDCGDVKVIQNLNASMYLGTWYEHARYSNVFETNTRCVSATYSLNANGTIEVVNKALDLETDKLRQIEGTATPLNGTEGLLEVSFDLKYIGTVKANYSILGTDYNSWAAVYSCEPIGVGFYGRFAWLLTRDRNASEEVVNNATTAFTSQGIVSDYLLEVNQTSCGDV